MKARFYILSFLVAFVISNAVADEYGNEWIVPSQKYYKISTAEDGIYRITYNELAAVGFPVSSIDPRRIQLFHRGVEQAIKIDNQNDASFDPDDYLEFYGKRNDGTLDEGLYVNANAHKRKYYNFYSDTTAYFLTWSLSSSGKRIGLPFDEDNILNLPAEPYHFAEHLEQQAGAYATGLRYPIGGDIADTYLSAFDYGEGWTGAFFNKGSSEDVIFTGTEKFVTAGPKPVLELLLTGGNNRAHTVSLLVGPDQGSLRSLADINFNYLYDTLLMEALEWSDFSGDELVLRVINTDDGVADRISVTYAKLDFAESWNQESKAQKIYNVAPSNTNRSYIEIQNVLPGSVLYDITDETDLIEISYNSPSGNDINAVIPNGPNGRKLLLTNNRIPVPNIRPVSMRNMENTVADYLMVTHQSLRGGTDNYTDVPKAYAEYRASTAGGGYDTLLVNIDELYNIFSYGEYTSLAIYRFCRYMADKSDPKHLFIIGKGLSGPNLSEYRLGPSINKSKDLVPTAGFPGSDILFTAGLNGSTFEQGIPVGRIAAESPQAVEAYFEKVKEMEEIPHDALWRKELAHLSGGKTVSEQNLFRRYVDGFKSIAEGEMLGGNVSTNSKTESGTIEISSIAEQVNEGRMLVTFFGHSGLTGTDIHIGNVSEPSNGYNNKGKYPMLLVNGCNAGDMFINSSVPGFGEDWILTPDKGAVGFVAHTNNGLTSLLRRYTNILYEVGFTDSLYLKKGIGEVQKGVGNKYLSYLGPKPNELDISQVQQMALHGDPAVTLFGVDKPDYEINADNVFTKSLDGEPINAFTEVFSLGLIVSNFGATHGDSLKVTVNRKLSNGEDIALDTLLYYPVFFQDTLYFEIESVGIDGFGINLFSVNIDPLNEVEELDKSNNQTIYQFSIPLGGTNNIAPVKYAITNKKQLKLITHSMDLLMEDRTYLFELDTTTLFGSPYRKQISIQTNSMAKWSVDLFDNLPDKDTIVFYWRTKFANPRPDEFDIWNISSFTYIKDGLHGWAMAHFQQFDGNELKHIETSQNDRLWEFEKFATSAGVRTFGKFHPDFDIRDVELTVNNTNYLNPVEPWVCDDNSMNLLAFSKTTTLPYVVLGGTGIFDQLSCGNTPQQINTFTNTRIQNELRIEQYIDQMGDGDFVVLFSIGNVTYQSWPATTVEKLAEIGVKTAEIESLLDGEPLIILGKKGSSPGSATIITADYSSPTPVTEQEIALDETIIGQATSGTIRSPKIGPAKSFVSFHQLNKNSEVPVTDSYSFDIIGVDKSNNETILSNTQLGDVDLRGIVDSLIYPYVRLEMKMSDETNLTPPQLKNWFVIYDGLPEGVLSYKEGQAKQGIQLNEGKTHEASFVFENVSDLAFQDSIAIEYNVFNQDNRTSYIDTIMVKPLLTEEYADFTLEIETLDKVGKNDLNVFVNPYMQQEQSFNNNLINLPEYLTVNPDNTNPILEVTVDGEFIMDGDIVSPSPIIMMRMKDENGILVKEDTLGVNLYLNEKCVSCPQVRVNFSSPNLIWTPATAESDFTVEYQPQGMADGIYTLKAEAADASGNQAGSEPYAVNFEIVNESQITNFFPYPNPFSSRTQFVFTLTGSEIPDEIIIQIMTVNGTVVREITQDEMGPIRIGHNKTEYAWDGKDEYGDQLANGVYLYKVKIFNDGNEMKHRSTSADQAFKNGIGKLYLLR